jgi:hypothetical protein
MAIPQIDQRLLAACPAKARLKAQRLVSAAIDAESAFMAVIARQDRLREEVGAAASERRQAVDRARSVTDKVEEHQAAGAEYDSVIAELQDELARLEAERARREQRRYDSAQLVAQVRAWLETVSARNTPLAMVAQPPPALRNGETPLDAIRRVRDDIAALERELIQLRRAALPSAELKMKAREFVRDLALAGTPSLHVQDGAFRVDFMPGAWATSGTMAPAGMPLLCWLFGDAVIAKLDEIIERVSGTGLASADRMRRETEVKDRLLTLQRTEESLIEMALDHDFDVWRRPAAAPEAILGLRNGVMRAS